MIKRFLKISSLFLVLSIFLTGCTFTFPWEKEREPVTVNQNDGQIEINENGENNQQKKADDIKAKGELRKFKDLSALKTLLTEFEAPAIELETLFAAPGYGPVNSVPIKKLTKSSVIYDVADTVKVGGNYTYAIEKNHVHVVKIAPLGTAQEITKINFPNRPLELAISGNYLAVSGLIYEEGADDDKAVKETFLVLFDISNPETPVELRSLTFSGNYLGLRLSSTHAYFLSTSPAEVKAGKETLPKVLSANQDLKEACAIGQECLTTQVYYFNHSYDGYAFLSFAAIDLADKASPINRQIFLLDGNYNLHISEANNLYLSRQAYLTSEEVEMEVKKDRFLESLSDEDKDRIKSLENSSDYVLNENKRNAEIKTIIDTFYSSLSTTEQEQFEEELPSLMKDKVSSIGNTIDKIDIYKFTILSNKMLYQAQGTVNGRFLTDYFMDEENGYLRVATRRGDTWSLLFSGDKKHYSNVYILNSNLIQEGALENITTSANMKTASFMEKRVYLTTEDASAPIYVIDLKDDSKPEVLGALQVGEFAYYYPVNQSGEKLLAVGRHEAAEGTDEKSGLKVSIYDFTDLKQPKELSSYVIGDEKSLSIALSDYKSLANIIDRRIIIMPASFMDGEALSFAGVLVFTYNEEGKLSLDVRIDHSAGGYFASSDTWRGFDYYDNSVRRSFVQGNNVFTFSNKYIKVNNLTTGEELAQIILIKSPEDEMIAELKNNPPVTTPETAEDVILDEDSQQDTNNPEEMEAPAEDLAQEPAEAVFTGESDYNGEDMEEEQVQESGPDYESGPTESPFLRR